MADTFQTGNSRGLDHAQDHASESFMSRPVRRLALITPWAGGNLGNSAIISSVIHNLSRRVADIEFVGVTLNCERTHRRFAIESFPLTATTRPYQGQCEPVKTAGRSKRGRNSVKQWLREAPLVAPLLKVPRMIWREIRHILAASRLMRRLDCVVVPGGGALDEFWGGPWGHPWSLFKWSVISWMHRVPFLFLSVGKCSLERPASRFFVKVALKLASYRSYRDPESKNAVQSLFLAPMDPTVPDLAFSYPVPAIEVSRANCLSRAGRLVIGFSPIAYCDPRVWPLKDQRRYASYLQRLTEVVKWLLKQDHQLIFFATDSPDLEIIKDLFASITDFSRESDAILTLPGPVEQTIDGHLQGIARADLVVASRLHGVILSHLAGVPTLAISFDPKVNAHMAGVNQTDYCLDIDTFDLKIFAERFERLKAARSAERTRLQSHAQSFRRQLDMQYDRIFGVDIQLQKGQPPELMAPGLVMEESA